MKKLSTFIIAILVITLLTSVSAFAGSKAPSIKVNINNKNIKYDIKPYMNNGEVMLPVKQTSKALGATYEANKETNTVWVNLDMMHVELPIGKSELYIHRDADFTGIPQTIKLNTEIKNIKGTVFVPGKTFCESLGMTVSWDDKKRVLSILKQQSTDIDLTKPISYTEITAEDIAENKSVYQWYNANYKKSGIKFMKQKSAIYVLVGAGKMPTGGYSVGVDKITFDTETKAYVFAYLTKPAPDMMVTQVITYPNILIKIDGYKLLTKIDGEISLAKEDSKTSGKEKWVTMDNETVTKMELFTLEQVKIKDITGNEKDEIIKSFNEATIDQNPFIEMITGSVLKVTMNDGYVLSFTSYGSKTNVVVNFSKDEDNRTFHLVAPIIAYYLLQ